jgi:hypothetical protein
MMGIKKSLGYSPLGEPKSDDSQFNFVADRKPAGAENVSSVFKEADRSGCMKLASSFSEKVIKKAEEDENRPKKKVASYYLEIETLQRLKLWAEKHEVSYSSVVEESIRKHLVSVEE